MSFAEQQLQQTEAPRRLQDVKLPKDFGQVREVGLGKVGDYTPSPIDWRDEVLYFLLVDRFNDGKERPLLNRDNLQSARPAVGGHGTWWWGDWAESGKRFQGGNLKGVMAKLDYLKNLGITTIWLSPIFKQRGHEDSYHGYGVQNFLDIDPRFGTRQDLVELVAAAHIRGMRIILDIIFNHSGHNWNYEIDGNKNYEQPNYKAYDAQDEPYKLGSWLDKEGKAIMSTSQPLGVDDAVWPEELQNPDYYTRRGFYAGALGDGDIDDPHAVHKVADFYSLRDFNLDNDQTLDYLAKCYKYWIALADIDGFRIDTLKHVAREHARNFCGTIKEYAARLGKTNFLLIAEVAGGDNIEDAYLDAVPRNLDAVLEIGELRLALRRLAKGLDADAPRNFFSRFEVDEKSRELMPSHRVLGSKHVLILDDHDHVMGEKTRFAYQTPQHQIIAGVALQMLCLGIPCIYYGTEQEFRGPEPEEINYLVGHGWNSGENGGDRYLREAMFGPEHPLKTGLAGRDSSDKYADGSPPEKGDCLPGFGAFGTAGFHCFDENYYAYKKIAEIAGVRRKFTALRYGRQYHRPISYLTYPFSTQQTEAGQIAAWSRILDRDEFVCILNANGGAKRGARIAVDKDLNRVGKKMYLVLNTTKSSYPDTVEVKEAFGYHYIEVSDLEPSGVLIYANVTSLALMNGG